MFYLHSVDITVVWLAQFTALYTYNRIRTIKEIKWAGYIRVAFKEAQEMHIQFLVENPEGKTSLERRKE